MAGETAKAPFPAGERGFFVGKGRGRMPARLNGSTRVYQAERYLMTITRKRLTTRPKEILPKSISNMCWI